ncbi:Uncharacterized protein C1F12.05 [Wickerhamiella sorbophila]|uniref:Uncharacterized protein C1F12.05 n=1 Tax=Wickerhamiella sorbophila TaxID=45607 RepID=A0A2T0FPK2_9ASCO|nr:Uncharacterized protein C1F12.05 [Wickerhamiella sorbophila]PRT56912.1 Uncharacterized protein C1F12.05 [Wickerhamiella sorbophila]
MTSLLSGISSRRRVNKSRSSSGQNRDSPEPLPLAPMQSAPASRIVQPSPRPSLEPTYSSPATSRSQSVQPPELLESPSVQLQLRVESPPLVMYGARAESTGALLTGIMDMQVNVPELVIEKARLIVVQRVVYNTPATSGGKSSHMNTETLAEWQVLTKPQNFTVATHGYPFSHLMPGSLPPTCSVSLFSVGYYLRAEVLISGQQTPVVCEQELRVKRSVINIQDKTSVRVFPPTELSLSLILPSAVFPKSNFTAEIRLEGVINDPNAPDPQKRWKPKKLTWRFFQTVKVAVPGGSDKPIDDTQVIGEGVLKTGWKVDFSHKGLCELIVPNFVGNAMDKAVQDVDDPVHGLSVSHRLSVEMLLAEEIGAKNSRTASVTGSARVLRMQFSINVVDRPGLGISWDDEVPPVYADVPLSPPTYATSVEDIRNHLFSPTFSPAYSPALGASVATPSPTLRHIDASLFGPESRRANRTSRLSLLQPSSSRHISPISSIPGTPEPYKHDG